MKSFLTIFALLMGICHPVRTPAQVIDLDGSTTRAVVVGISDYQDPEIPDLRFADKDAQAFAGWLQSPAGGSLEEKNQAAHQQRSDRQVVLWIGCWMQARKATCHHIL
ncbi:MAG: hypothetical protein IPM82_23965 [Saprospiraceae bacterium]|nr:hypothetical protein [Saprospiraceae bacterium]